MMLSYTQKPRYLVSGKLVSYIYAYIYMLMQVCVQTCIYIYIYFFFYMSQLPEKPAYMYTYT